MVFNTQIYDQTTNPKKKKTGSGFGGNFTRCATSSQISKTVALALEKISSFRADMSPGEWKAFQEKLGKHYNDELEKKKKVFSQFFSYNSMY